MKSVEEKKDVHHAEAGLVGRKNKPMNSKQNERGGVNMLGPIRNFSSQCVAQEGLVCRYSAAIRATIEVHSQSIQIWRIFGCLTKSPVCNNVGDALLPLPFP